MGVKYSKFFTVKGALSLEPVTILVKQTEDDDSNIISIESLEGEYLSVNDLKKAIRRIREDVKIDDKIHNILPLKLPDAVKLVEALNEAIVTGGPG
ncbi:unnamed protein product [marine sediment metagenome]|uniref:Uncharacterized protein n=1 Tax=marine sediment metagenome TaxID=412755 RepID=X1GVW4_9ZZZZ